MYLRHEEKYHKDVWANIRLYPAKQFDQLVPASSAFRSQFDLLNTKTFSSSILLCRYMRFKLKSMNNSVSSNF